MQDARLEGFQNDKRHTLAEVKGLCQFAVLFAPQSPILDHIVKKGLYHFLIVTEFTLIDTFSSF